MSKNNSNVPSDPKASSGAQGEGDLYSPFSAQPTSFIETTFAGSLGISMHNEVSGQQSARLTSLASTTNACKLLLQSKAQPPAPKPKAGKGGGPGANGDADEEGEPGSMPAIVAPEKPAKKNSKWGVNLGALTGFKKKPADEQTNANADANSSANSGANSGANPASNPEGGQG